VDGTDANNARVIRNSIRHHGPFFLSEKEKLLNNPRRCGRLTRLWVQTRAVRSRFTVVAGVYACVALDHSLSWLAAIGHGERERQGHNLAGLCLGDRPSECCWVKSPGLLLVGG